MNEELRKNILFTQSVVSLGRDLILIVIALFAVLIVYFGGDPRKLSELDWALLIGGALIVVIAPVVGFYIMALFVRVVNKKLNTQLYYWGEVVNVPRSFSLFWYVRIRKISLREYVIKWKNRRTRIQKNINNNFVYRIHMKIKLLILKFGMMFWSGARFMYAGLFLLIGSIVFYELFIKIIKT